MFKFVLRLSIALSFCWFATALSSAQLPVEARNADGSSEEEEVIATSYVLPNQIFNNGKPYYASKDPVSGQLDFNLKKPAGIDAAVNEVVNPNEKAVITSSSPNIHDFLNLPVKYSPSKFVYPLVSSSYANLKYQGSNKNYITNKKPTQVAQAAVNDNYHTANYYTVPTTKLTPVDSILPPLTSSSASNSSTGNATTTTRKPAVASASSTSTSEPTASITTTTPTRGTSTKTTTTLTTTSTTTRTPAVQTLSSLQPTNNNQQFTTSTRKPTQSTTTEMLMTTTTRKKFIPNKKYSSTPVTTTTMRTQMTSNTPLRFPDSATLNTTASGKPTNTSMLEFNHPTKPSTPKTTQTVVFTEDPTAPPPFSPFPSSTHIPNLDPADVYHSLGQKYSDMKFEQKPTMTLADIFNSLVEEESAVAANNPMNQGLDAQGNLMEPLDPSKPSPFAVQHHQVQKQNLPPFDSTDRPQNVQQQSPLQTPNNSQQQQSAATTSNKENFSNEYVSYQVQQPNILQYRPAPGAINNVVISPGQSSASFVLGSQQQVGQNAFGSVEKEPLFSKEHHVQYGTVINEDISGIKRQPMPSTPNTYQEIPNQAALANFHQNGNFVVSQESKRTEIPTRPLSSAYNYPELPPAPPSPYQQLPLVGNTRSKPTSLGRQKLSTLPPTIQSPPLLPSTKPNSVSQSVNPQNIGDSSIAMGSHQDTKDLLVSTNVRFPANDEPSVEMPSLPVENGPPTSLQVNGHAQPLSLQQIQSSNPVVFPKQEEGKPQQNEIVYHNNPNPNADSVQIQKQEVLTMSQHQQKLAFPSNENTPYTLAQHMVPPPLPNAVAADHDLQKLNRPHGNSQYSTYNEYTRKPIPGITRPNPDRHLPNILPQFRPNAKISSGHPQQTAAFSQESGNIRVTSAQQPKRSALTGNPQFSHRRQPLGGQPKRYPLTRMAADYPAGLPSPNEMVNRRVYRVSPYGGAAQYLERHGLNVRRPLPQNLRPAESVTVERHAFAPVLEKLPAFEEEDLVINDPPQPVAATIESGLFHEAKLEPVVTLQMLQSHKKPVSLPSEDSGDGEIQVPGLDNEEPDELGAQDEQNGLYVVYPIKGGQKSESIEAENQNILPAVAHIEPPTGSEYQNTPFSITRDYRQEPVLKNKKPLSLQQHNKVLQTKDSFPYPIEKPDPAYADLKKTNTKIPGVIITPKITNGFYGSATETPIAIAYTPTEASRPAVPGNHKQNLQQLQQQQSLYSNINLATPVIKEIRPNDKAEETLNGHDFDLRAQNYEKDFMAPFYPSVSLDTVTIAPTNGWNILSTSTDHTLYEKNKINRSDVGGKGEAKEKKLAESSTTKSFELDKFQPELQGGFKPIYPPGYKLDNGNAQAEQELEQLQQHITKNKPLALALANPKDAPQKLRPLSLETKTTSSTMSSTTSTTTTSAKPLKTNLEQPNTNRITIPTEKSASDGPTKPTKRTKSKFETSLAALLFGEDEEEENAAGAAVEDTPVEQTQGRQEPVKAMLSGPRSMPRMGPRSL